MLTLKNNTMLNLKKISSHIPYSDSWWEARLGTLTASKIFCICGDRGIGDGGMTYIRNKVGEKFTRKTSERNVTTEATQWGVVNEPIAVKEHQEYYQIPAIVTDKHLIHDDLYAATPDGIIILKDLGESYDAETLESKSYPTYSTHMEHCECNTALEIKAINKQLFWQVVMQMYVADVIRGNAIFFHPDFDESTGLRLHRVVFNKIELISEFKLLSSRMEEAKSIYNKLYLKFKNREK